MNRDRKHLLGVVLADDVVVEDLADPLRGRNIVARFPQQGLFLLADNVQAKLDAFVANEYGRPGNELAHLVLALAAERAVERVLRIAAANLAHSEPPSKTPPCSPILSVSNFARSGIYALEGVEEGSSKSCLSNTSRIERLQA